ncbi:MAG TPA: serine/threonine-protein kinase, partial [Prosthecobacter sp.]|nr:serine/threonine-protein kinase [Prosthecobacter sp.]
MNPDADLQTIRTQPPTPPVRFATGGEPAQGSANYHLGREVARGGMGCILEAEDRKLARTVAAKAVLLDSDMDEGTKQRFIREAEVLARLSHPNIVPIYDIVWEDGLPLFYTMKLVKGRTLQHILNELCNEHPEDLRDFTLDRLLLIFRKVCDAVAFAHSKGVLHRDLKPENIMVGEFGEVLVMDWGLAKVLNDEVRESAASDSSFTAPSGASPTATLQGAVMGTPKYMSPEQAMGQIAELDERSDIFSLGGILYAILTLRPPVDGKDLHEILEKVKTGGITPPTAFGVTTGAHARHVKGEVLEAKKIKPLPHIESGRVPAALSAVAMKALALDKAKRYQNVAAFSADIERYQTGFATSAENAGFAKQAALLIKRNKGIFTTAFAAWLVVTALAVWFVFNLKAKEQRATEAEAVAVQEKETARQALAKSQIDLAEKEFERGKFIEAQKILTETPESFRDANWRFLQAHSSDFTARLSLPGKGAALRLQFLPQGDRFAARCSSGVIGIFSLTGRQIGDSVPVNGSGAFRIDSAGGRIAFAASASEVAVQEVATGKLVHRWTCELGENKHVLLSPDGATVLVAGGKQLIVYAAQTGAPLWTQPFNYVVPAFSPDGRTVAIVAAKTALALKIELRDTLTGTVRSTIEASADNDGKEALQFNQAGDRLACLGRDEVILWNPQTATKIRGLHFPGETVKLISPGGDAVATISGSRIRLWDTATGRLLRSFNGAGTDVVDLAFSPDGRMLLSTHVAAENAILHVWPTRRGEEVAAVRQGGICSRVLFDRDGSTLCTSAQNAVAWNSRSGVEKWTFSAGYKYRALDLALHPVDGSVVLSAIYIKEFIHLSSTGKALAPFGINYGSSVKFNRDGRLLLEVEGAFHQTYPGPAFSVVEYPTGKVLRRIPFENPRQPFAAFCLDDAAVATAAPTGGITVWDWQAGTPLRQIAAAQTGSIACLASSPDGR